MNGSFDNDLMEAPVDDQIDMMNDETFGDGATGDLQLVCTIYTIINVQYKMIFVIQ